MENGNVTRAAWVKLILAMVYIAAIVGTALFISQIFSGFNNRYTLGEKLLGSGCTIVLFSLLALGIAYLIMKWYDNAVDFFSKKFTCSHK